MALIVSPWSYTVPQRSKPSFVPHWLTESFRHGWQARRNEFRGGGIRPWGPLWKRPPSAKRTHKLHVRIANCLKNSTMSVWRAHFKNSGPLRSHPRDQIQIAWARMNRSPGHSRFSSPDGWRIVSKLVWPKGIPVHVLCGLINTFALKTERKLVWLGQSWFGNGHRSAIQHTSPMSFGHQQSSFVPLKTTVKDQTRCMFTPPAVFLCQSSPFHVRFEKLKLYLFRKTDWWISGQKGKHDFTSFQSSFGSCNQT